VVWKYVQSRNVFSPERGAIQEYMEFRNICRLGLCNPERYAVLEGLLDRIVCTPGMCAVQECV